MDSLPIISCDVLVVGAGTAGISAAISACENGASVVLAVKGRLGGIGIPGSGASSCGGSEYGVPRFPELIDGNASMGSLFDAIVQAGLGVTDRRLAKVLVEQIPVAAEKTKKWGVHWGGLGPATLGYPLTYEFVKKYACNVQVLEDTMMLDAICSDDGICIGAYGIRKGNLIAIAAPSVIIATGGCAGLFSVNVHPPCVTGDGHAIALRAGARLWNMEFAQYFPMTVYPTRNLFHFWNESSMRDIRDREDVHVISRYLPANLTMEQCIKENVSHAPFSTRDTASRYFFIGVMKEILAGNCGSHRGIFADLRGPDKILPRMQYEFLKYRGIDAQTEQVELSIGYQCSSGGIEIDEKGRTAVPGLYAIGEAAAGMHGADRLGGNMLAASVVWGILAGCDSAQHGKIRNPSGLLAEVKRRLRRIRELPRNQGFPCESKTSLKAEYCDVNQFEELKSAMDRVKSSAWEHLLVIKTQEGLMKFLDDVRSAGEQVRLPNVSAVIRYELENILLVGTAIAQASLQRKESRGSFYREDFPDMTVDESPLAYRASLRHNAVTLESFVPDADWKNEPEAMREKRWG